MNVSYNINNNMKVKLTEVGWNILISIASDKENIFHMTALRMLKSANEEGWLEMQCWEIFEVFSIHLRMGNKPPFETTIYLSDTTPTEPISK